jgi:2-oxoglutarate dehydrogenase E2 component (dihydrolipoamide succinyltransferase)
VDDVINGLRRLKREDVEASMVAAAGDSAAGLRKPASREATTERLSSLRRKLSERLVSVKNETAMLTTFNEVDMKPVMDLRNKYQHAFVEKHGIKLGMMSFFLKACSVALLEYPRVNAMMDGENLVTYDYADISVAVSAPKGLMVPVIRNVESLGLAEVERAIAAVAEKARNGKLSIPEMTGGTFTVTNGGVFGSMMSTPIINPPQSAILGMHNILERPVAVEGQVVIRPMMYVALSYDHRVIDGKDSVSFLVRVKRLLENPVDLLFGKSNSEKALLEI